MLLAAAVMAIVTQEPAALRASPHRGAPRNAVLWRGDAVEVRGQRAGYLQVWDYRRERGGYLLETEARAYPLDPATAPALLEVVRFLRDVPEMESLGIGHAALYLRVAPAAAIDAEIFDAIGAMSERLARRASARWGRPADESLAGHLDVAQGYGVHFTTVDPDGHARVCDDGEAFTRALQLSPSPEVQARAVLGLTRLECERGSAAERYAVHQRAAESLSAIPLPSLPVLLAHRVRLRRTAVEAMLAYEHGRAGRSAEAETAANRAIDELALVPHGDLAESDEEAYTSAALRAAVSRPAVEQAASRPAPLSLQLSARAPGETCLALRDAKEEATVLVERCTYGVVWPSSIRVAPRGAALSVAVQPLAEWRELWVFHRVAGRWAADVIVPAGEAGIGYVEWAGWTPDGARMLVARETKDGARPARTFEVVRLETMAVERKAGRPADLTLFHRWQAPEWKGQTLALR
jgi:hypothetical protein